MAKTLIMLGSSVSSSDTQGRDFQVPLITAAADITVPDAQKFGTVLNVGGGGDRNGRAHFELRDKNDVLVFEMDRKLSEAAVIRLSTETGVAAAGTLHNLAAGTGHWIIDAASFATGKIIVEINGKYGRSPTTSRAFGSPSYQEFKDCAGRWALEFPFTVTE